MKSREPSLILALTGLVTGALAACGGDVDPDSEYRWDGGGDAETAEGDVPCSESYIHVQTKSFIAHVNLANLTHGATHALGIIDAATDLDKAAQFLAMGQATNLAYTENPADGHQASGEHRIWSDVVFKATCSGSTLVDLSVQSQSTDAGYEGPLKGSAYPLVVQTSCGGFYVQASGSPSTAAEVGFQVLQPRSNTAIWNDYEGTVSCNADGSVAVNLGPYRQTSFPSVGVWYEVTGATNVPYSRVHSYAQSSFSTLWSLEGYPGLPALPGANQCTGLGGCADLDGDLTISWTGLADAHYDGRTVSAWINYLDTGERYALGSQNLSNQCGQPDAKTGLSFPVPDSLRRPHRNFRLDVEVSSGLEIPGWDSCPGLAEGTGSSSSCTFSADEFDNGVFDVVVASSLDGGMCNYPANGGNVAECCEARSGCEGAGFNCGGL